MATTQRKSKFYRYFQIFFFVSLTLSFSIDAQDIPASNYSSFAGVEFFLLSDTTFSSSETAKVRVEIRKGYENRKNVEEYGGVDITVYKINSPINFLRAQKNLHRISTKYNYRPKGILSNASSYLWDSFYKKSRLAWQRILSFNARKTATEVSPNFRQKPPHTYKTHFKKFKQFGKIKGLSLIDEFRYPLTDAKSIAPPQTKLQGSSHNFNKANPGNVYVPLGKLKNGLYLVEAIIGDRRANTLVFISDTVLISKISSKEIFLWAVEKKTGRPMESTKVIVSDGLGTLKSGETNEEGILKFDLKTPEMAYLIGQDEKGGVFISENYYYDSEIYSNKIYTFTDRPLYRPGDKVFVKVIGRSFQNSRASKWIQKKSFRALIIDSAGMILSAHNLQLDPKKAGGEFSFRLPKFSLPGGYTILLKDKHASFSSEFRVSRYSKPHYSIDMLFSSSKFKLNQAIKGKVKLTYTNGNPVTNAEVTVAIRKQKLNIIEGETDAESLFPVKIDELELTANKDGIAHFELPAVNTPSRYILSVSSKDQADFRVKSSKEILIELDTPTYIVHSSSLYSKKGDSVEFSLEKKISIDKKSTSLKWSWTNLEDQSTQSGNIHDNEFELDFQKPGTYRISILNSQGQVVGGKTHIVQGKNLKTLPGTISITLDKSEYEIGKKVKALINFSSPVENALITLERDKIEKYATFEEGASWIDIKKINSRQWELSIEVNDYFAPNLTLSVLFVKDGQYVFQNKGIVVKIPKIKIGLSMAKTSYRAKELVKVKIKTSFKGKPIPSNVTMSVVDEMIYVLQPELAPKISDFFYHRRRNQVKTSSSLDFHTYDSAISATGNVSGNSNYDDRPLKMRERPRREDVDTAFWKTNIQTNNEGIATISFTMPDSMTRWRITSRAVANDGKVGQSTFHIKSSQNVYLKWASPTDYRFGDKVQSNILAFNNGLKDIKAKLKIEGVDQDVNLSAGVNFLPFSFSVNTVKDLSFKIDSDKAKDFLRQKVLAYPRTWKSTRSKDLKLKNGEQIIDLPKKAFNIRLTSFHSLYQKFLKSAESLITYPHGCVEQTTSKLIALTLAYNLLEKSKKSPEKLMEVRDLIIQGRDRLLMLANEEGLFGWYQDMPNDSFLTSYAYLADFLAAKILNLNYSKEHWNKVLEAYRKYSGDHFLRNSLSLWMNAQIGLPVQSMAEKIFKQLRAREKILHKKVANRDSHFVMNSQFGAEANLLTAVFSGLSLKILQKKGYSVNQNILNEINDYIHKLQNQPKFSNGLLVQAALLAWNRKKVSDATFLVKSKTLLNLYHPQFSTADRSIALLLIHQSINQSDFSPQPPKITGEWKKAQSTLGFDTWQYTGKHFRNAKTIVRGLKDSQSSMFRLYYDSFRPEKSTLPITLTRELYRLDQREGKYVATPVDLKTQVSSEHRYIDIISLSPDPKRTESQITHGLVQVPLPPGGQLDKGLGKLKVTLVTDSGSDESIEIDDRGNQGFLHYKIPIRSLTKKITYYHIVHFPTKGEFNLPQSRIFDMYNPESKAYRNLNKPTIWKLHVH